MPLLGQAGAWGAQGQCRGPSGQGSYTHTPAHSDRLSPPQTSASMTSEGAVSMAGEGADGSQGAGLPLPPPAQDCCCLYFPVSLSGASCLSAPIALLSAFARLGAQLSPPAQTPVTGESPETLLMALPTSCSPKPHLAC